MTLASGSYGGRPPRPPSSSDRSLYTLGKSILNGKIELQQVADEAEQQVFLLELQEKLPIKARSKVNLVEFAGKLTDQQLQGIKSYLAVRYKVK